MPANPGRKITCPNGHYICRTTVPIRRYVPVKAETFTDWAPGQPVLQGGNLIPSSPQGLSMDNPLWEACHCQHCGELWIMTQYDGMATVGYVTLLPHRVKVHTGHGWLPRKHKNERMRSGVREVEHAV